MDAIARFKQWFEAELSVSKLKLPAACCLSTLGLDGYPNARFVSLKEVSDEGFIVTGPMDARKGQEMRTHPKAALTFWWSASQRQVRIQGDISPLDATKAHQYFAARHRDAQIVSAAFEQGQPIASIDQLKQQFVAKQKELEGKDISTPAQWGGILLFPQRIEFMQFQPSRLHERILFTRTATGWDKQILQP